MIRTKHNRDNGFDAMSSNEIHRNISKILRGSAIDQRLLHNTASASKYQAHER